MDQARHSGNRYEQHRAALADAIHAVRLRMQWVAAGSRSLGILAGFLVFLLVVVVADQARAGGLSLALRRLLLAGFLVVAGAVLVGTVIRPLLRRINDFHVAWMIERTHPEFRNSLVTSLQFRDRPELPGSLVAALVRKAARDVYSKGVDGAVRTRSLKITAMSCTCAAIFMGAYGWLSPIPVLPSIRRALGADIPAPTRTQIRDLSPPDGHAVIVGQPVMFDAELAGQQPDRVLVQFSEDGGRTWGVTDGMDLAPQSFIAGRSRRPARWNGWVRPNILQHSVVWRLRGGDATSESRHLEVRPRPDIDSLALTVAPPRYTGLPKAEQAGGRVEALAGTQVDLRAKTNVPAVKATIIFGSGAGEIRREMMQFPDDPRQIATRFLVAKDDWYRIEFADELGNPNADPITYPVVTLADRVPTVVLVRPKTGLELGPEDVLSLEAQAEDDFGLTALDVLAEENGSQRVIRREEINSEASKSRRWRLDLPVREITTAEQADITYWVAARDNREDLSGKPDFQEGQSEHMRLRIRPPDPLAMAPVPMEPPAQEENPKEGAPAQLPGDQEDHSDKPEQGEEAGAGEREAQPGEGSQHDPQEGGSDPKGNLPEWVRENRDLIEQAEKTVADAAKQSSPSGVGDGGSRGSSAGTPGPQDQTSGQEKGGQKDASRSSSDGGKNVEEGKGSDGSAGGQSKAGASNGKQQAGTSAGGKGRGANGSASPGEQKTGESNGEAASGGGQPNAGRSGETKDTDQSGSGKNKDTGNSSSDAGKGAAERRNSGESETEQPEDGQPEREKRSDTPESEQDQGQDQIPDFTKKDAEDMDAGGGAEPNMPKMPKIPASQSAQNQSSAGGAPSGVSPLGGPGSPKPGEQGSQPQNGHGAETPGGSGQGKPQQQGGQGGQASGESQKRASGSPANDEQDGEKGKPGSGSASPSGKGDGQGKGSGGQKGSQTEAAAGETGSGSPGSPGGSSGRNTADSAAGQRGGARSFSESNVGKSNLDPSREEESGGAPPPDDRPIREEPSPPPVGQDQPEEASGNWQTIGKVQPLVDEIQRQLRAGDLDVELLEALEWTPARAAQFVKDFERVVAGQDQRVKTVLPDRQIAEEAAVSTDRRVFLGEQAERDAANRTRDAGIPPDRLRDLRRSEREKVSSRYRPLLDGYYQSLAGKPTVKTGKQATSRATGRQAR